MSSPNKKRRTPDNPEQLPASASARGGRRWVLIILLAVVIAAVATVWRKPWGRENINPPISTAPPTTAQADAEVFSNYAGSESCKNCHRSEYDRWHDSHHGLAERNIVPAEDKPAFDPPRDIHHGSQTSRAEMRDGHFDVVTTGLSGKSEPVEVQRVIGVDPLRQFLTPAPGGRMQALELAFDPKLNEWFDIYGKEDRQAGEWGHWTGRGMTWNSMCAACHNTRLIKNYEPQADVYQTRMAEMSVGCEACHGPMKKHAEQEKTRKPGGAKTPGDPPATLPAGSGFSRDQVTDTCGSCHARRGDLTGDFVPGDSFFDHYSLTGVDASETFYADGQVRDEDYEYSAFLGSRMHAAGVRCVDCHDVHSGKTLLEGNALCMKCHIGAYPKAPIINPLTHTFHAPASAGSQCVNCHMPQTKYMQRHGRHDHGFTVPDPTLTKQIGVPNACNRCHGDKDADWAIAATDKWYGAKMDRPARHRALTIASARKGEESAKTALLAMLKEPDEQQPFYWKSAFVRLLGRWANDPAASAALVQQLGAGHPLVREGAAIALSPLVDQQPDIEAAMKDLVNDKARSVRIAAAHALGPRINPESDRGREFLAFLNFQADEPTGQFQLAIYEGGYRHIDLATEHLYKALDWDKRSPALHREAAVLLGTLGKPADALTQIEEACRLDPADAEYEFLRGLAAAEVGKPDEAVEAMQKAVALDPHYARAWYNLGLMLQNSRNPQGALSAFESAEAADPTDPQIPYARAVLLAQLRRLPEARAAAQKALQILPGYADALKLLENLSR